jgi:hypothetical protein
MTNVGFTVKIKDIKHLHNDVFYIVTEWFDEQDSERLTLDQMLNKHILDIDDVLDIMNKSKLKKQN